MSLTQNLIQKSSTWAIATATLALLAAPTAQANSIMAGGVMGLTGARTGSSNPTEQSGLTTSRKLGLGLAVSLGIDGASSGEGKEESVNPFGLEIGAWYLNRKFEIGNNTLRVVRSVPTLMVPVEARISLLNIVSISAGPFAAFKMGDATNEVQSGTTTAFSFSSTQRKTTEFGGTIAAEVGLPIAPLTHLTFQGRYWHGFTNAADDSVFDEKISDITLLAGLRFGM